MEKCLANIAIVRRSLMIDSAKFSVRVGALWKPLGVVLSVLIETLR